jgi:hypothetical protein
MENLEQKAQFLREEFTHGLAETDADTPRKWGKMNLQQMIEHMADYVRIASGKMAAPNVTPEDVLPRMQKFLDSEKPFPENTPNVLMPAEPTPAKHATKEEAIAELQAEIDDFFAVYEQNEGKITANPFFGDLDFEHQVQLLHKHATHHLRQFGVEV